MKTVWVCVGEDGRGDSGRGVGVLWCVGLGGCPAQGLYYDVEGFPMLTVFWNKGVPAGEGLWGSGTPLRREKRGGKGVNAS